MAIANNWVFTETNFKAQEFLTQTKNRYRLVSQRPYTNKKDSNDIGVLLTLQITQDETDYGVDKNTGIKRENNVLNTFDVTILNGNHRLNINKGDYLRLIDFVSEKSFVIGFDLILRFKNVEKIDVKTK